MAVARQQTIIIMRKNLLLLMALFSCSIFAQNPFKITINWEKLLEQEVYLHYIVI